MVLSHADVYLISLQLVSAVNNDESSPMALALIVGRNIIRVIPSKFQVGTVIQVVRSNLSAMGDD